MRRMLVPLLLVGSILLVQSPAHAYHKFYQITLKPNGENLLITVVTDCGSRNKLVISSPSLQEKSVARIVPPRAVLRPGLLAKTSTVKFTTKKLAGGSSKQVRFTARCGDDRLCPKRCEPKRPSAAFTLSVPESLIDTAELPWTGASALPWLTLGLCLVLAGGLLLVLGRRRKDRLG